MKGFFKSEWTGKWEVGLTIGQCYQWGGDGGGDKAGKSSQCVDQGTTNAYSEYCYWLAI